MIIRWRRKHLRDCDLNGCFWHRQSICRTEDPTEKKVVEPRPPHVDTGRSIRRTGEKQVSIRDPESPGSVHHLTLIIASIPSQSQDHSGMHGKRHMSSSAPLRASTRHSVLLLSSLCFLIPSLSSSSPFSSFPPLSSPLRSYSLPLLTFSLPIPSPLAAIQISIPRANF